MGVPGEVWGSDGDLGVLGGLGWGSHEDLGVP